MRNDLCALILSHKRAARVYTYHTLRDAGYSGQIFIVVDDEDPTIAEYQKRFGDQVVIFNKAEAVAQTDDGNNFGKAAAVVYARNICHDLVRKLGFKFFLELDDDYVSFRFTYDSQNRFRRVKIRGIFDDVLDALIEYYESIPALALAFSQGGDWMGGGAGTQNKLRMRRKCMNTFLCSVDRPFKFYGQLNEDTTTYTYESRKGQLFFTLMQIQMDQVPTQQAEGGLTDLYLAMGTYVKSFYSVMWTPSSVKVGQLQDTKRDQSNHPRVHHQINIDHTYPKILRENAGG